jgi:hypothetical protein
MALNLAAIETVLVRRLEGMLRAAGMAVTTAGSTSKNIDLADPVMEGILATGGTVADHITPTDADLLTIPAGLERAAIDVAEIRAMENVLGNFDKVTFQMGKRSVQYNDIPKRIREAIATKTATVIARYGSAVTITVGAGGTGGGPSTLGFGTIDLGFSTAYDPWDRG